MPFNYTWKGDILHLIEMQSMYLCSLWQLHRADGVTEYFTNWDEHIQTMDPEHGNHLYQSSAGIALSANSKESGLRSQSLSATGLIDGLDVDLLAGGVYDKAKLTEWIVDARWPWLRGTQKNTYIVSSVEYSGDVWRFELEGNGRLLKETIGVPFSKPCRYSLGQGGCATSGVGNRTGVNIVTYTYGPLTVSSVNTTWPRQAFQVSLTSGSPPLNPNRSATFPFGRVRFLTQIPATKNDAMVYEVMSYDDVKRTSTESGEFQLYEETVVPITTGIIVDIEEGCDGKSDTCKNQFNNYLNFGGNDFIPGTQKSRQSARINWNR